MFQELFCFFPHRSCWLKFKGAVAVCITLSLFLNVSAKSSDVDSNNNRGDNIEIVTSTMQFPVKDYLHSKLHSMMQYVCDTVCKYSPITSPGLQKYPLHR